MTKFFSKLSIFLLLLGVINLNVFSQSTISSSQEISSDNQESSSAQSIDFSIENNCRDISSSLNDEYIRLDLVSRKYVEGIKIFNVQAVDLIKVLDGAGTDVDEFELRIVELEKMIFDFENLNQSHRVSLNELSNEVCLLNKDGYNIKFLALVEQRKELFNIGVSLETLIKEDVKNELSSIRGQYRLN